MSFVNKKFGFDLDNTLINYSKAVKEFCISNKLKYCESISELRTYLRKEDSSDQKWQFAQGWLYTEGLQFSEPGKGSYELCEFLELNNCELQIVSHKTPYSSAAGGFKDLRGPANDWIENSVLARFFNRPNKVHFELTKAEKVKKIQMLSLNYFVDDLDEIFMDLEFPKEVIGFLLNATSSQNSSIKCVPDLCKLKEIIINEY